MTNRLLVVSAGVIHPSWWARKNLKQIIYSIKDNEYVFTSSVESLKELSTTKYAAVILYFHKQQISKDALQALDDFVKDGGGLLAVHSASASFKKYTQYFDILGGRFVSHGKVEKYAVCPSYDNAQVCPDPVNHTVTVSENISRIFSGVDEFKVKDELYFHQYDPKNTIHFYAQKNGKKEPVVWTRHHGNGRVCYISLGHCAQSFKNPSLQKIIRTGICWVSRSGPAE